LIWSKWGKNIDRIEFNYPDCATRPENPRAWERAARRLSVEGVFKLQCAVDKCSRDGRWKNQFDRERNLAKR